MGSFIFRHKEMIPRGVVAVLFFLLCLLNGKTPA